MKDVFSKAFKVCFLAFILCFTTLFSSFSFASDLPNKEEKEPNPKIRMAGDGNATLPAGKETVIDIPIINTAQSYAYELLVQAKTEKDAPFTIKFLNGSNRKNIIERVGSSKISLAVNVDKSAPTGTYPVTLEFSYTSKEKESFNNSDIFYIKIQNQNGIPSVILSDFKASKPSVVMGQNFDLSFVLQNDNVIDVKDLSLQVLGLDESNISLVGGSDTVYYKDFEGTAKIPLTYKFSTNSKTKEGSNKLTFKVTYYDIGGKQYTREFKYYIDVLKSGTTQTEETPVDIKILSLVSPSQTLQVNESGTFTIKLKNNSKAEVKNIKVSTKIPEGLVPTSANTFVIQSFKPNEEKTLSFSVAPTSSAKTQVYSVGFAVETMPKNEANATPAFLVEQYGGVKVNNPNPVDKDTENKKTSVPKIIISKYQSDPMIVEAGKPFDLAMTFKNTHPEKTIKNIKLFLTMEDKTDDKGNVFAPNNSSTTFYIDQILPKSEVSHVFNLFTVPTAKPRSYTINVNFEYEDEAHNEYKNVELVGVNVKQQVKIEVGDINMPSTTNIDEPIFLNFQIFNTGKVNVSNLKVDVQGDGFDTSSATNFIGNFDVGSSEFYDSSITPIEVGKKDVTVTVSYEDAEGKKIEIPNKFTIDVQGYEENPTDQPIEDDQPPSNFGLKKIAKIIVILIIIIAIIIFILTRFNKRARRKKGFEFDE